MRKIILIIIICVLTLSTVSAVPTISQIEGDFSSENSITINGADFGVHNMDFNTLVGSPIELTTDGQSPASFDGWYFNQGAGFNPIASTDYSRSGTKSLKHDRTDGSCCNSALRFDYGNYIGLNNHIYITWWTRADWTSSGQWKMFRLNWQNDIQDDAPQITLFNWIDTGAKQFVLRPGPGYSSEGTDSYMAHTMTSLKNQWYRQEIIINTSSGIATYDGTYGMGRYVPDQAYTSSIENNKMSFNSGDIFYRWFIWQNYAGNGLSDFISYTDDHYIQIGTPARVELCDTPTWSQRTQCDIQVPTSWQNNQVTINVNEGGFLDGETAYIYIVDENNEVNENGYEITIGEDLSQSEPTTSSPEINSLSDITIENNQEITISGTNFGTHLNNNEGDFSFQGRNPICAKYKDFEDELIESQGFFVENNYDNEWSIDNLNSRGVSNFYAKREYVSSRLAMLLYQQSQKSTGQLYTSFYFMPSKAQDSGKPWRWYAGDSSSRDNIYLGSSSGSLNSHSEASRTDPGGDWFGFTADLNKWHRIEIFADKDENLFEVYIDSEFMIRETDYFDALVFVPEGHGVQWGSIGNENIGAWNYDDLYVDYTQARIEICDNQDWNQRTHCEIQIPNSWSENSISFTSNQGAFQEGDRAYLFVIDENGNVSNAQQITITDSIQPNDFEITSISDSSLDNNQEITISGNGFGDNGPNVVIFDDFEKGVAGNDINLGVGSASIGEWSAVDGGGSAYYGYVDSLSGELSFSSNYEGSAYNWIQTDLPENTRNLFISWWLFLPADNYFPGETNTYGTNWKQMWIQGSSTTDDDLVVPTKMGGWLINGNDGDPGYSNYVNIDFNKGEWKRLWIWLKGSTTSTSSDGEMILWELDSNGVDLIESDLNANLLKESGAWERVRPNGWGRSQTNCITSFDDIYIASGIDAQARVEIGNAPIYEDCTKLTLAVPTSWSDNSITARFFQGPFDEGDSAYLFVIDSNGNVTNSYPVTIGSGTQICSSHSYSSCYDGDLYWYDSCNTREEISENCQYGCDTNSCNLEPELTNEIIIDNSDSLSTSSTGTWSSSTYFPNYYSDNYMYSSNDAGNTFTWSTDLVSGEYEVYAWWSAASGRPTDAEYEIFHGLGSDVVVVNQEENDGQWNLLGTYNFADSASVTLTSTSSSQGACADAVRFLKLEESFHEADTDNSGYIEFDEIIDYVDLWLSGQKSMSQILEVINIWRG